jgi:hypothetical protein
MKMVEVVQEVESVKWLRYVMVCILSSGRQGSTEVQHYVKLTLVSNHTAKLQRIRGLKSRI